MYLIKPVQRICKYPLLLKTVHDSIGDGPSQAAARARVKELSAKLTELVTFINSNKVQAERYGKMADVSGKLRYGEAQHPVSLSEPHRMLVCSGTLLVLGRAENPTADAVHGPRFAALYNDALLLAVPRKASLIGGAVGGKTYDVCSVLPLKGATLLEDQPGGALGCAAAVRVSLPAPGGSWMLGAASKPELQAWVDGLKDALAFVSHPANRSRAASPLLLKLAEETRSGAARSTVVRRASAAPGAAAAAANASSASAGGKGGFFGSFFSAAHAKSATLIQKSWRGKGGRAQATAARSQAMAELQATLLIQRGFRRFRKRVYWNKQREYELIRQSAKARAALKAQQGSKLGDDADDDENKEEGEEEQQQHDDGVLEEVGSPTVQSIGSGESFERYDEEFGCVYAV
jgi:hypothetical protein